MIGVVLAGGASARFGGRPKGLVSLAGRAMALRVADVLGKVAGRVMIEAPAGAGYEALELPLVHASVEHAGRGPLAGLAAGLAAADEDVIAFAPCDMPLLNAGIYRELLSKIGGAAGAYAASTRGVEPIVAVLRPIMLHGLLAALQRDRLPRTHVVLDQVGANAVAFADATAFENVNTPADLERIEARFS